jgi:hypothetical protein
MHGDIEVARSHCLAMRAVIIHHLGGREDGEALGKLREMSRNAAAAIDDVDCTSLLSSVEDDGADLFSKSGHLKWATTHVSGAYFLRLQILRELDAFDARLLQLEATRNAAAARSTANSSSDRRSPG